MSKTYSQQSKSLLMVFLRNKDTVKLQHSNHIPCETAHLQKNPHKLSEIYWIG